jgi:hypothetical protein
MSIRRMLALIHKIEAADAKHLDDHSDRSHVGPFEPSGEASNAVREGPLP